MLAAALAVTRPSDLHALRETIEPAQRSSA
jgi:hypothetical protein